MTRGLILVNLTQEHAETACEAARQIRAETMHIVPANPGRVLAEIAVIGERPIPLGQMPAFREEIVFFWNIEEVGREICLALFRDKGLKNVIKAVNTPVNMNWTLTRLRDNLIEEHRNVR